jgi:hypothetical protein
MRETQEADVETSVAALGETIQLYEATLADYKRVLGHHHPDTLTFRSNLAGAHWSAVGEAIPLLERIVDNSELVLGHDQPHTLASRKNLAAPTSRAGCLGEAIVRYELS